MTEIRCRLISVIRHLSSDICHLTPSRALTQPRQDLETGIAVGGRNANFSLELLHRTLGIATDPAIAAFGVEAECGEAALQLLHLGKRHQPLATWEGMYKWAVAADAVGEMHHGEAVGKRRVIARHGGKILPDQKGRAAVDRHG